MQLWLHPLSLAQSLTYLSVILFLCVVLSYLYHELLISCVIIDIGGLWFFCSYIFPSIREPTSMHSLLIVPFRLLSLYSLPLSYSSRFLFSFPFQFSHSPLPTAVSVSSYKMHYALVSIIHYKYIMPTHLCSCKR